MGSAADSLASPWPLRGVKAPVSELLFGPSRRGVDGRSPATDVDLILSSLITDDRLAAPLPSAFFLETVLAPHADQKQLDAH